MGKILTKVFNVINGSDVVLEVLDARFPRFSKRLEKLIKKKKKKLVIIFNKIDLVDNPEVLNELKEDYNALLISSKTRKGKRDIMKLLYKFSKNKKEGDLKVGVIGLPNVGKSSLINALRGKKVARTSTQAGYTRGKQWIRLSPHILLIDSPGVITWDETEEDLIIRDSLDVDRAEDPIKVALQLLDEHSEIIHSLGISSADENGINEFARITGKLKKGGEPNTNEAAKMIIRRWQRGQLTLTKKKN